ncbi:MAG TPA: hypothetical protein VM328_12625, partial [Fimbriimonadaceae bacterium]|nr:hypothetical protein [Fimbriimonadaceae bacterium]
MDLNEVMFSAASYLAEGGEREALSMLIRCGAEYQHETRDSRETIILYAPRDVFDRFNDENNEHARQ